MPVIQKLLVANRGEIASRVFRTARALGMRTVAVFSDADAELPYVGEADEAVRLGPPPAAQSYLDIDRLLEAARRTGADAVHPGYGFLSENAAFAKAVVDAGLTWVGPPASAIEAMGDKAAARRVAMAEGVPVVPGYDGEAQDDATFLAEGRRIGLPLLVKASAGGGGRGMRRVDDFDALPAALASAKREAASAFGSDRLLLERYVTAPRHIEVQVFADTHGNVVHLGERECSVQRRHQKVFEEAPSPAVGPELRERLGEAAVKVARAVGYVGAGTVEFVLGQEGAFYFLEMNTRLQVEHPVTECVTGLDLVALQLTVAEGRALPLAQADVVLRGHAIEARVVAEDPNRDWMPASGTLVRFDIPVDDGVRVDAGYATGSTVSIHYDAMLAKVIAFGPDRDTANRRLRRALDLAWVPGLVTNLPLLRDVVRDEDWVAGRLDTGFLPRRGLPRPPPMHVARGAVAAALWTWCQRRHARGGPDVPSGWRLGGNAWESDRWSCLEVEVEVELREAGEHVEVRVDGGPVQVAQVRGWSPGTLQFELDGRVHGARLVVAGGQAPPEDGDTVYVHLSDAEAMVMLVPRFPAPLGAMEEPGSCVAPTPGVVRAVHVQVGARVDVGAPLVTLEAMKMEHHLSAPLAGTVASVRCAVGDAVDGGMLLVRIEPDEST